MFAPAGHPYCTYVCVGATPSRLLVFWCTGCGCLVMKRP